MRLTQPSFRYRGNRNFSRAALRPTIAHAMVWLSSPKAHNHFIDPCCGSGTILSERTAYPAEEIIGGDLSNQSVKTAEENLKGGLNIDVHVWDARKPPVDAQSMNKVVTNLPFGKQIATDENLFSFNQAVMKEIYRITRPQGIVVVLSESSPQILIDAEKLEFECLENI